MPDFILNKLVRDGIPGLMKTEGQTPVFFALEGLALQKAILIKIKEEVDEAIDVIENDEKFVSELADIQELVDRLLVQRAVNPVVLNEIPKSINDKRGAFKDGLFLEKVSVDEDSEWTHYYRAEPDRFIESGTGRVSDTKPKLKLGVYEHYKRKQYEVIGLARHTETLEWLVVYKPLYEHDGQSDVWVRPLGMFKETVKVDGKEVPRFKRLNADI